MPKEIFRKSALDQFSSPEELDRNLEVTAPRDWLALLSLISLLVAASIWSVRGRLPTRVAGQGILVSRAGLNSINAPTSGQVAELYVRAGTELGMGQPVARLLLPELDAELRNATANHMALVAEDERLSLFGSQEIRLRTDSIGQQRATALSTISLGKERQAMLAERLIVQQQLLKEGLITELMLQNTRDMLTMANNEVKRAEGTLAELELMQAQVQQRLKQEAAERQKHIAEAHRKIEELQARLHMNAMVASPKTGRVLEVRTAPGQFVSPGTPIVLLELQGEALKGLEAILYVPAVDGKKLQPGMAIEVSPSTVKREEYGTMRAVVTAVSAFPATQQAMLADLGNPDLVAAFLRAIDSPLQVRAQMRTSATTVSGYEWTSPKGPPTAVQPGTLCRATITVRERAPISLIIPLLREKLGL